MKVVNLSKKSDLQDPQERPKLIDINEEKRIIRKNKNKIKSRKKKKEEKKELKLLNICYDLTSWFRVLLGPVYSVRCKLLYSTVQQ